MLIKGSPGTTGCSHPAGSLSRSAGLLSSHGRFMAPGGGESWRESPGRAGSQPEETRSRHSWFGPEPVRVSEVFQNQESPPDFLQESELFSRIRSGSSSGVSPVKTPRREPACRRRTGLTAAVSRLFILLLILCCRSFPTEQRARALNHLL